MKNPQHRSRKVKEIRPLELAQFRNGRQKRLHPPSPLPSFPIPAKERSATGDGAVFRRLLTARVSRAPASREAGERKLQFQMPDLHKEESASARGRAGASRRGSFEMLSGRRGGGGSDSDCDCDCGKAPRKLDERRRRSQRSPRRDGHLNAGTTTAYPIVIPPKQCRRWGIMGGERAGGDGDADAAAGLSSSLIRRRTTLLGRAARDNKKGSGGDFCIEFDSHLRRRRVSFWGRWKAGTHPHFSAPFNGSIALVTESCFDS